MFCFCSLSGISLLVDLACDLTYALYARALSQIDLSVIARHTSGYSGAELELLCREAAMYGLRELFDAADSSILSNSNLTVRFVGLCLWMPIVRTLALSSVVADFTLFTCPTQTGESQGFFACVRGYQAPKRLATTSKTPKTRPTQ